ncbi:hypothetical protein ACTACL_21560 [Pseudomonas syringae]|uniref:hypothetical protein n=1 Tax=Pseudomonas syringae TaxID=317 RepID=UPI003F7B1BAC
MNTRIIKPASGALNHPTNVVLARTMVRDLYQGQKAAQKLSTLMTMMAIGGLIAGFAGIVVAINAWADWGGLPLLMGGCFLFVSATRLVLANSIAGALNCLPEFAGSASALAGALQYGSGIFGSALVAIFSDGTHWPMGLMVAICGIGCTLSAACVLRIDPTFN